jgi:dephospho-CoA kinase
MATAIALSDYIITNENGIDDLEKGFEKLLTKLRNIDGNQD